MKDLTMSGVLESPVTIVVDVRSAKVLAYVVVTLTAPSGRQHRGPGRVAGARRAQGADCLVAYTSNYG